MKLLGLIISLFSFAVLAKDLNVNNYLKLQDSLASDDFKSALSIHQEMCKGELKQYSKNGKTSFKDITQLRSAFKELSSLFLKNAKELEMKGLMIAECPMAGAKWIQKEGKIRNPYYGESMLECGGKVAL
jgi:hypothetical protein